MIEKISLDNFEIVGNYALVKIHADYDFYEVPGADGTKVVLQLVDFTKSGVQLQSITGKILKAPERLNYHGDVKTHKRGITIADDLFASLMRNSMPYDVEIGVKEGDNVVFDVKHAIDAEEIGLLVDVENVGYAVLMPYEALYAKQIDDVVVPLNGYVLLMRDQKPSEYTLESGLMIVEKVDKYGSKYATVIDADVPPKEYIDSDIKEIQFEKNQRVLLQRGFGYRMADDSFAGKLKGIEVIRAKNIMAII